MSEKKNIPNKGGNQSGKIEKASKLPKYQTPPPPPPKKENKK